MLAKRIIPCLDICDGRAVKGVNFVQLQDAGDPVELAWQYARQGADELVFLDIHASYEQRKTRVDLVKAIAIHINIPFTIGGGIHELADADILLNSGADKISVNSAALKNPKFIEALAKTFGQQFVVLAVDTKCNLGKHEVYSHGGRTNTGKETKAWVKEAEERGAGEVLLTSMDRDGTRQGFDNALIHQIGQDISIPLIASGGAGGAQHFVDVFQQGQADAALAASIFHYGEVLIPQLKQILKEHQIQIRM